LARAGFARVRNGNIPLVSAAKPRHQRTVAVLFDRDGTVIENVPYNGDPALVRPRATAVAALELLRSNGIRTGVVTNQSGVAKGLLTRQQAGRVNRRVEQLLGPFDVWQTCYHDDGDHCGCRKPAPGMVLAAAAELGVAPDRIAVIGDIESDVLAALAAGARAVMVPTAATRQEEIDRSPLVAADLLAAVAAAIA
jgi:D-glycero-D-manno-heptose 1,7-bisphosphate phosphatase